MGKLVHHLLALITITLEFDRSRNFFLYRVNEGWEHKLQKCVAPSEAVDNSDC